jgi:hypothetical protein
MQIYFFRRLALVRSTAMALVALMAVASTGAGAAEDAKPQVVSAGSLPKDCKALGEVTGRHAAESPSQEEAERDAVREAKGLGATHVVTDTAYRCGGNSFCYEGKAYRCPSAAPASPGK